MVNIKHRKQKRSDLLLNAKDNITKFKNFNQEQNKTEIPYITITTENLVWVTATFLEGSRPQSISIR